MKNQITDNPELKFSNIDHELYRTYVFPNNTVVINSPVALNVSRSGGHRILDSAGISHYIPTGWCHLYWEVKDKNHFRF